MAVLYNSGGKCYVVVEQGDTLSQIAVDYKKETGGASYRDIAFWNAITNPNLIYVNQKIYLTKAGGKAYTDSLTKQTVKDRVYIRDDNVQMLNDGSNTLYVAWTFGRVGDVKHYKVEWQCYDSYNKGFGWETNEVTTLYHTYKIPDDIKSKVRKVTVKIIPVAKDKVKLSVTSVSRTYNGGALPSTPSNLTVTLEETTLSAKVTNVGDDSTHVVFQYAKNNTVEKESKVGLKTGEASTQWTIELGNTYKVRCCGYNNKISGPWSDWSENFETIPGVPTITKCEPYTSETGETCIKLEWSTIANATGYKIRYVTAKEDFDITGKPVEITPENLTTSYLIKGDIKTEITYYFRVMAKNAKGDSEWSKDTEESNTIIADAPSPPSTWSSSTVVETSDEMVTLYWTHNSADNSVETKAWLNIYVDGVLLDGTTKQIDKDKSDAEKGIISRYELALKTAEGHIKFRDGAQIEWQAATAGASGVMGEWSQLNRIDLYAPANLTLDVKNSDGNSVSADVCYVVDYDASNDLYVSTNERVTIVDDGAMSGIYTIDNKPVRWGVDSNGDTVSYWVDQGALTSLPFTIEASVADLANQEPIGYFVQILPKIDPSFTYDTVDETGNSVSLAAGVPIYERNFGLAEGERNLSEIISAGDIRLEDGMTYIVTCIVSMSSGLTDESSKEFEVSWEGSNIQPGLEVYINRDEYSASLTPYCSTTSFEYRRVNRSGNVYVVTDTILTDGASGDPVDGAETDTGEQVWKGFIEGGTEVYYCVRTIDNVIEDRLLSIFRREYDGTFTKIAENIDSASRTTVVDPHPALDYARYRVVATPKTYGPVTYYDTPEYPVGGTEIILQWDEPWSSIYADPDQPFTTSSMLKLPYNIDLSPKSKRDVSLVKYIGRNNPVSYYGTQRGEGATWSAVIPWDDTETLYALRRLQAWGGDVYVREPSGTGYWANVEVTYSQKHKDLTIPITIEVTRVEGGI